MTPTPDPGASPSDGPPSGDQFLVPGPQSPGSPPATINLTTLNTPSVAIEFLVPTFAVSVPGLLVILSILGQLVGASAWLPTVRRNLGSFGLGRRRRRKA